MLDAIVHKLIGVTSGFLFYAWIIPGSLLVLVFMATYFRFFLHLPKNTRFLFLIGIVTFVGGALLVESFNASVDYALGTSNLLYEFSTTFEEFMEMLGVLIIIYALLDYIEIHIKEFHLTFKR